MSIFFCADEPNNTLRAHRVFTVPGLLVLLLWLASSTAAAQTCPPGPTVADSSAIGLQLASAVPGGTTVTIVETAGGATVYGPTVQPFPTDIILTPLTPGDTYVIAILLPGASCPTTSTFTVPLPGLNLAAIHKTFDDMDRILSSMREGYLQGQVTLTRVHRQIDQLIAMKFSIMNALPPWGPSFGIGGAVGTFSRAYTAERRLDDAIFALRDDKNGFTFPSQVHADTRTLRSAFNIFADMFTNISGPETPAVSACLAKMRHSVDIVSRGVFSSHKIFLDDLDTIENCKWGILDLFPRPIPNGIRLVNMIQDFGFLDTLFNRIDEAAAAGGESPSTSDEINVLVAIDRAISDKHILESAFPAR
jgi:hypothetical protein